MPRSTQDVARAVNALAWPVILENIFQSALSTADMLMVATLGAAAVAGIGTAGQVLWVLQAALAAVTTGTTVLVARFIGAGKSENANVVVKQSLLLSLVLSLLFGAIGFYVSHSIIAALGAEPEVVRLGGDYLRITTAGSVTLLGMMVAGAAMRGAGDTKTPMVVTGLINLVNIAAAYVLIFGKLGLPALGVTGAAWAVTFARALGTAVLLWLLWRGRGRISIRGREGWQPHFDLERRLVRLGLPSMAEQLLMSGGMLLYGMVAISLGTKVYAAQRITFQVISYAFMPGMGFAMSATTMMGQCLGAKRSDLGERCSWYAVKMAVIQMTAVAGVMALFGRPLMRLFTSDAEMIAIGAQAMLVLALSQPFQAIGQVLAGALRGAGDTRFPMVATFLGVWLIRLPLGFLFGPLLGWGLAGIYIANIIDGAARAAANYWRYRSGRWRSLTV
ncbi:MAG: MATE family efflux transporter [Anaerolineae bacterium]